MANRQNSRDIQRSRRQFLQQSAAAVAVGSTLTLARGAHAAGDETLRLGVIGCGGRGAGAVADALTADPNTRLVAMADLFADRAQGKRKLLQEQFSDRVAVEDDRLFVGLDAYRKVIDCADVVLIACAAKFHPQYLLAAVEAGKHVFVEKPHAIDPYGIHTVKKACALAHEKKVCVVSGLHSRFHAAIRETIERVRDGQIGEIVSIEENFLRGPYGNVQRPQGWRELEVQYGNQYRFSWLCGDDVTQSLVHNLDRATWAMGETPPVDCHGLGGRSGPAGVLGDVFDHHSVIYRYANGVKLYAFCRATAGCHDEGSSIISGSQGTAYPILGKITGAKPWRFSGEAENPYVAEHRALFSAIRSGAPLHCGDYMVRSTLVAIMGQLSCYSGREITWDAIGKSAYHLPVKPEDCTWDMTPPTLPDTQGQYPVCAVPGVTQNV